MKFLVVSNPRTARARRQLQTLQRALPQSSTVAHRVTEDLAQATKVMIDTRWHADDTLVINGGDGTAQRLLTLLLTHCPPQDRPRVALLPGGTTNMTAFDVNTHRGYRRCLESLCQARKAPQLQVLTDRPLVRVTLPDGNQYGFFFGVGTIVQGIEYFHQRIHPGGGRHELGAGLALLRTLWGIARHQPPFAEPLPLYLPAGSLETAADLSASGDWIRVPIRLCLVTALQRLFLGIRPYWNQTSGPLRATLVEADADPFISSMPRLLRGRPGPAMTPEDGYHSTGLESLQLRFSGALTLDGELFSNRGDTISIEATDPLRFLIL